MTNITRTKDRIVRGKHVVMSVYPSTVLQKHDDIKIG